MNVKLNRCVVIRHAGDESVVWAPRTAGSLLLKDARIFLDQLSVEWQDANLPIQRVANEFECNIGSVRADFEHLVVELEEQDFVLCKRPCLINTNEATEQICQNKSKDIADDVVGGFCRRNNIVSELHLDLTDACTEKCVHCYVPQEKKFIPYEQAEKVLREFRAQNGLTVYLTGGECMLHSDFKRICELCVDLNLNIVVMTNLTCCDEEMVRFLRKIDPQYLNVSLYSMSADEHDAVTRLPGSWRKTMDAILACEKAGVHIRIATPLLKENQTAFVDLKRFADEHHMHLIPSCDIVAMADHDCQNINHACSGNELKKVLCANREIFDREWDCAMPKCDAKVCDIGTSRLYVNAKGDYYPCDSMHGYVLGNVATHTVADIWNGEKLAYLRALKNKNFGKCVSCVHRPWCKVCPAANFNATGNLFCPHESACERAAVIHEVYGREKTKC